MIQHTAVFVLALILLNPILSYADQGTGSIVLSIKNEKGDLVNFDSMTLKIYQDFGQIPYKNISVVTGIPYVIPPLPLGHQYKIEVYVNSMHIGVGLIKLQDNRQALDIVIPNNIGMRFIVLYNDGVTPIAGATVSIKSNNDMLWRDSTTDNNGQTQTFWLQASLNETDYYYAEVSLGPHLVHVYSPITHTSSSAQEFKVVTKWPPVVKNLITIQVYKNPTTKVDLSDGNLAVEIRDYDNKKIVEEQVNSRGEAYLSNIKVNDYLLFIVKKSDSLTSESKELVSKKITITGSENMIKIFLNNPELNGDELNCRCVAFRLDDVQDNYVTLVQLAIIKIFQDRNASLTVGIQGAHFGKDQKLVGTLKDIVAHGNPTFEPANHGWNHLDMKTLNRTEQSAEINQTNVKMASIFGFKPTTFIPPFNRFNDDTLSVMQANNMTHISYHIKSYEPPPFKKSTFYHFPGTSSTASREILGAPPWTIVSADVIFKEIQNALPLYGYAVVNMHPYEFAEYTGRYINSPNQTQIQQLGLLIDKVNAAGYKILTIGNIDSFDKPIVAPQQNIQNSTSPNCNCIAFRLDVVQDHYLNNVGGAIIKSFQKKNVSLTIGLFGDHIGDNAEVVDLLKDRLKDSNPPLKFANRGWDNLDHTQYGKDEQLASIKKTSDKISKIFGITPTIFIPPYNKFNNDTLAAIHENGIRYLSSSLRLDSGPYDLHNGAPFHIPQTVLITDLLEDDPFYKGTINEIALTKIKSNLNQYEFSVATLRAQDFAVKEGDSYKNQVDVQKLQNLESLIDYIKSNGLRVVTIDQIPQMATSQKSPNWINSIYTWYQEGRISHDELLNAVNYLIKNNIIKSDH